MALQRDESLFFRLVASPVAPMAAQSSARALRQPEAGWRGFSSLLFVAGALSVNPAPLLVGDGGPHVQYVLIVVNGRDTKGAMAEKMGSESECAAVVGIQ
jgi:hypothetical protein